MDRPARPRAPSKARTLATATTLGLGALAGLAAYAVLAPVGLSLPRPGGNRPRPPADDAPGRTSSERSTFGGYSVAGKTVTIARPRDEVFAFWRDLSNLARFMESIEAVREEGDRQVWTLRSPAGGTAQVTTRLVNEKPGEQVAWRSTEDSEVDTEGKVMFRDAPAGRGTEVEAIISWRPKGGEAGRLLGKLFQQDPSQAARRDLRRLKMLLETGEIATAKTTRAGAREAGHPTLAA